MHYPTSAVKQQAILERVLLFMGITAVDELCHVDKQCMDSVCNLLELPPIARSTVRCFFGTFGVKGDGFTPPAQCTADISHDLLFGAVDDLSVQPQEPVFESGGGYGSTASGPRF